MILTATLVAATLVMPRLVQSSRWGLHPGSDVMITAWQQEGELEFSNGFILSRQWCSHDLQECVDDQLQGCPIDECTHVWTVYSCCDDIYLTARPGIPIMFWATNPDGMVQRGTWSGPGDWNMDGSVGSTDLFAFLSDFFDGGSDQNLDGRCDSTDFFEYLDDFFAV